jgi:hypothetical protein
MEAKILEFIGINERVFNEKQAKISYITNRQDYLE